MKNLAGRGGAGLALFAGRVSAAGLLFVTNLFLARSLGPAEFGRYALAISILTFLSLFLDVGYFSSGARLLTALDAADEVTRGLLGGLVVVTAVVCSVCLALVGGLNMMVDRIFAERIAEVLGGALVLTPAVMLPLLMEQVLKAMERNYLLAAWSFACRAVFAGLVAWLALGARTTALSALTAYLVGIAAATACVLPFLRPSFRHLRGSLVDLHREHRRFGRPLYEGRLANLASYRSDTLMLGFFRTAAEVGHYSLAMSVANLIGFYSQSLATSEFRALATHDRVPPRLLKANLLGIVAFGAAAVLAGELAVLAYLGPQYALVGLLIPLCVAAISFQGAYQPYNSWLLAHGYGVELRSFLFVVAVINLVANLVLIPTLGALGAASASIAGMGSYLLLARRTARSLSAESA